MDEPQNSMLSGRSQAQRPHIVSLHLCRMSVKGKAIELESRIVLTGAAS